MPATPPPVTSNAQRRTLVLARVEAKLQEIWPDDLPEGQRTFADFDALEAAATRTGDTLARTLMEEALREVMRLAGEDRPEHCPKCGRKLQWEWKEHGLQTIRGPVEMQREYGYCRVCDSGFFPLGAKLPLRRPTSERTAAASVKRSRQ